MGLGQRVGRLENIEQTRDGVLCTISNGKYKRKIRVALNTASIGDNVSLIYHNNDFEVVPYDKNSIKTRD